MTLLETILITYILLNWFLTLMFVILPKRIIDKVYFLFIINCPPLIIGFIGELIKKNHNKRKKMKLRRNEKMRYLKGQIDNPDFTPIITDGKVYILRYNFEEGYDEDNEKPYWNYDEIIMNKNDFDFHKSIAGKQNDFITNFIADNLSKVRKV